MRRRNCKRMLAGMLCVVMILTNDVVGGITVQASEVGQMGSESPVVENERTNIRQRQTEGIAAAKAKGVQHAV